ncbi:MAG: hypothetical protein HY554_09870 [Elusimicrobia bacterium]|nr:hypothetical protein [Elusimicrobiota bacterium]
MIARVAWLLALAPAWPAAGASPAPPAPTAVSSGAVASPRVAPPVEELAAFGAALQAPPAGAAEALDLAYDGASRPRGEPSGPAAAGQAAPSAAWAPSYEYDRMFDLMRRLLAGPQARRVRTFLREAFRDELTLSPQTQERYRLPERIKDVSESQLMLLLQHNARYWPMLETYLAEMESLAPDSPEESKARRAWRARFRGLLREEKLTQEFRKLNDPLQPMRLDWPDGRAGYGGVQVLQNHERSAGGLRVPPDDLVKAVVDFIAAARESLLLNVFDFDLEPVADALVARAAAGVEVMVGIDKDVIAERPEVAAVFRKLEAAPGIVAVAVDSPGLNHQKMIVRDWRDPSRAKVLFLSGNLTRSCLSLGGDLAGTGLSSERALPNANHLLIVDGYLTAQVAAHNLIKTLDPRYRLRGDDFPLGGAYQIAGPEGSFMVLAFSPRGGLGEINRDVLRRVLLMSRGPIRMLQFAFSSQAVVDALIARASLEVSEGGRFDFRSVGDTPFALRPWSGFLRLSGYEMKDDRYVPLAVNPLRDLLGEAGYRALKDRIRIAPRDYGEHTLATPDGPVAFNAKLHHKVLISGDLVVAGTSFNFSDSAESNNEQMIVFRDPALARRMNEVFDGLYRATRRSVEDEVLRRNALRRAPRRRASSEDGVVASP